MWLLVSLPIGQLIVLCPDWSSHSDSWLVELEQQISQPTDLQIKIWQKYLITGGPPQFPISLSINKLHSLVLHMSDPVDPDPPTKLLVSSSGESARKYPELMGIYIKQKDMPLYEHEPDNHDDKVQ